MLSNNDNSVRGGEYGMNMDDLQHVMICADLFFAACESSRAHPGVSAYSIFSVRCSLSWITDK